MRISRKSLTFKISFFVVSIMLTSLVIFSLVFIFSERGILLNNLIKDGEMFANFSTGEIYDNYVQYYTHSQPEAFSQFENNIQTILNNNPNVTDVSLIGNNGLILFDSSEFKGGKYSGADRLITDVQTLQMVKSDATVYKDINLNGQIITEIVAPVVNVGGHVFSVRYLLSRQSFIQEMSNVYSQIASVGTPLIILVIIIAIPFTIKLVKPIKDLTKAVEKIRSGNFDVKTTVKSQDELGQLAATFNEMSDKLKESYSILESKVRDRTLELEKERKSLEKRVKERTTELEKLKIDLEKTVADRTASLEQKLAELERLNKYMVGREAKMAELKQEIIALKSGGTKEKIKNENI